MQVTMQDVIAEEDKVVGHFVTRGMHQQSKREGMLFICDLIFVAVVALVAFVAVVAIVAIVSMM